MTNKNKEIITNYIILTHCIVLLSLNQSLWTNILIMFMSSSGDFSGVVNYEESSNTLKDVIDQS